MNFGAKIAFGNYQDLQTAIDDNIIDERDIVIVNMKDHPVLFVINDNKEPQMLRSYINIFDSMSEANIWLNSMDAPDMKGQPIAILSSDSKQYNLYIVQKTDSGNYSLTSITNEGAFNQLSEHIQNTDNPHCVTYEQVGLSQIDDDEISYMVSNIFGTSV